MNIITNTEQLKLLIWLAQLHLDQNRDEIINMWITRLAEEKDENPT